MAEYRSRESALCREIEDAQQHVATARFRHSQGRASVDEVNAADRRLDDAHEDLRTHRDGRVPLPRD
jgi:hypothetical protein